MTSTPSFNGLFMTAVERHGALSTLNTHKLLLLYRWLVRNNLVTDLLSFQTHLVMIPVFTRKHVTLGFGWEIKHHLSKCFARNTSLKETCAVVSAALVVAHCFLVKAVLNKTVLTLFFIVHFEFETFATTPPADDPFVAHSVSSSKSLSILR